jgi:hypothetical protein
MRRFRSVLGILLFGLAVTPDGMTVFVTNTGRIDGGVIRPVVSSQPNFTGRSRLTWRFNGKGQIRNF